MAIKSLHCAKPDFWSERSATSIEKEESERAAEWGLRRNSGNWIIIVCSFSETHVCPSRMTDSAITRAGVAVFPRTIDVAVERINIGVAGNRSAAIFDRSGETRGSSGHIYIFFFLWTRETGLRGLTETIESRLLSVAYTEGGQITPRRCYFFY